MWLNNKETAWKRAEVHRGFALQPSDLWETPPCSFVMDHERQKRPPQFSGLLCERSWDLTELILFGTHEALWALGQTPVVGRRWLRASRKKELELMLQRNIHLAAFETEAGKEHHMSWMMWESVGLDEDNLWDKEKQIVQQCGRRMVQWGKCRGECVWWMGTVAAEITCVSHLHV